MNDQIIIENSEKSKKEQNNNFISKIFGKHSEKNMLSNDKENKIKNCGLSLKKKIKENELETHRRLNSNRSFGSEEKIIMNSIDSFNPINSSEIEINKNFEDKHHLRRNLANENIAQFNNLFYRENSEEKKRKYVNKEKEQIDINEDEDDNSSVIENPLRDDINN